jgi:hypothetical protein
VAYQKSLCSTNKGHVDQLDPIKNDLFAWMFAHSEQGIVVTKSQVLIKDFTDLESFGQKSFSDVWSVQS